MTRPAGDPAERGEPFRVDARTLAQAQASDVLALDASVLGSTMTLSAGDPRKATRKTEGTDVAIVSIDGPLAQRGQAHLCGYLDGYDWVTERFTAAITDPEVGAVVLRIDSPGGDLAGLEEAVRRMRKVRGKTGKAVFAYVDELAASAAYWIASTVANQGNLVVPKAGQVGSIGVIGGYLDEALALEAEGIGVHLFREPEGKAPMHPAKPVPEIADERLQNRVKTAAKRFFGAMGRARGLKVATIRAFNGATYEGQEAVDQGLADAVGTYEQVLELAASSAIERKQGMKTRAAALAAFGLAETATDEELFEAAAGHNADAQAAGELVFEMTGKPASFDALEVVKGWREGAQAHDETKQELETLQITQEAAARDAQCVRLVTEAGKGPGSVWADPLVAKDRAKRAPKSHLAKMSLEDLESFVDSEVQEAKARPGLLSKHVERDDDDGTAELTERELAYCKREGINPKTFASVKARQAQDRAED